MKSPLTLLFVILLISNSLRADDQIPAIRDGGQEGTGGDFVKSRFIREGRRLQMQWIMTLLDWRGSRDWTLPVRGVTVPVDRLDFVLDSRNIRVQRGPIDDNLGSSVAAVVDDQSPVSPSIRRITLVEGLWTDAFSDQASATRLTCHEIMRALWVNDDDFRMCDLLLEGEFGKDRSQDKSLKNTYLERLERRRQLALSQADSNSVSQEPGPSIARADEDEIEEAPIRKSTGASRAIRLSKYDVSESFSAMKLEGPVEMTLMGYRVVKPKIVSVKTTNPSLTKPISPLIIQNIRNVSTYYYAKGIYKERPLGFPWKDGDDLSESEGLCAAKQYEVLRSLRDASNRQPLSKAFRQLMKNSQIENFAIHYTTAELTDIERLKNVPEDGNKNTNRDNALLLKRLQNSYLALVRGPVRPKPSEYQSNDYSEFYKQQDRSDILKLLEIYVPIIDGHCEKIFEAEALVDRLSRLVGQNVVSEEVSQ